MAFMFENLVVYQKAVRSKRAPVAPPNLLGFFHLILQKNLSILTKSLGLLSEHVEGLYKETWRESR